VKGKYERRRLRRRGSFYGRLGLIYGALLDLQGGGGGVELWSRKV
jgi:hypothetical protein